MWSSDWISVQKPATSFFELVIESVDREENTIGSFMDPSKAFGTVKHDILLSKLQQIGIKGISLHFFNYIKKQDIKISHIKKRRAKSQSSLQTITYGVPQGFILGPILFFAIKYMPEIKVGSRNHVLPLLSGDYNIPQ